MIMAVRQIGQRFRKAASRFSEHRSTQTNLL